MELGLYIVITACLLAGVEGLLAIRGLRATIVRARRDVPTDEPTGLLNHRAFQQRIAGELKRAKRDGGTVWLGVWTVVEGDPDRFGRRANDGLRFPEVGFRLAERVFCFARPNATDAHRADLAARLEHATPRNRAAIGESVWVGADGDEDPMLLLHAAIDGLR